MVQLPYPPRSRCRPARSWPPPRCSPLCHSPGRGSVRQGIRVWTNFKPSWQRGQKGKSCDGHKPFRTRLTFAGFLHPAASFHLPFLCASFAAPNPPDFPRSTPERVPQQELGSSSRMSVFACFLAQAESLLKTRQRVYSWGRLVPVAAPAPTEMSTSQGGPEKSDPVHNDSLGSTLCPKLMFEKPFCAAWVAPFSLRSHTFGLHPVVCSTSGPFWRGSLEAAKWDSDPFSGGVWG